MPTAFNRSCTHLGAGPFLTPRISRPAKIGQASLFSGVKSSAALMGEGNLPATGVTFSVFSVPRPAAARSRAMPNTLAASPRLGVMETSISGSLARRPASTSAAITGAPTLAPARQLDDAVMVFAQQQFAGAEHIMPRDSTPRMVPSFRASPVAGMTVPGRASTTLMPARALGAPQTICSVVRAGRDAAQPQLVGIGMLFGGDDFADDEILQAAPGSVTLSTSRPMAVRRSAIWSTRRRRCRDALSARRG